MNRREVVLCNPVRTAIGTYGGSLKGHVTIYDSLLYNGLNDALSAEHSGRHTEDLVTRNGISRAQQGASGSEGVAQDPRQWLALGDVRLPHAQHLAA